MKEWFRGRTVWPILSSKPVIRLLKAKRLICACFWNSQVTIAGLFGIIFLKPFWKTDSVGRWPIMSHYLASMGTILKVDDWISKTKCHPLSLRFNFVRGYVPTNRSIYFFFIDFDLNKLRHCSSIFFHNRNTIYP